MSWVLIVWTIISVVGTIGGAILAYLYAGVLRRIQANDQTVHADLLAGRGFLRSGLGRLALHVVHLLIGVSIILMLPHTREVTTYGLLFTALVQLVLTWGDLFDYWLIKKEEVQSVQGEDDV